MEFRKRTTDSVRESGAEVERMEEGEDGEALEDGMDEGELVLVDGL